MTHGFRGRATGPRQLTSDRAISAFLDVKSPNPHLSGKVVETSRTAGQVEYELVVQLDFPIAGRLPRRPPDAGHPTTTNRKRSPVAVKGVVESEITISPASLFLGTVQPGHTVTRQVAVKSQQAVSNHVGPFGSPRVPVLGARRRKGHASSFDPRDLRRRRSARPSPRHDPHRDQPGQPGVVGLRRRHAVAAPWSAAMHRRFSIVARLKSARPE